MFNIQKHFDLGSLTVILITLVLFVLAIFEKGLTHDVLLEAGVFLVSAKLILMVYRNSVSANSIHAKLDDIYRALQDPSSAAPRLSAQDPHEV